MKFTVPVIILAITAGLIAVAAFKPAQSGATLGIASGPALPGLASVARTPEQAVTALVAELRKRNWGAAYAQLANRSDMDEALFRRDVAGSNGSLRTLSGLDTWDIRPLRATNDEARVRVTLHWSTAVGPRDEVRDLTVLRHGNVWKVVWPVPQFPKVPAQVVPVNYLRWDVVTLEAGDDWGERNFDAPRVRIVSMNAVDYQEGSVVMGEVVNEDTIPAFVNVNAILIDKNGDAIAQESSFDKVLHVLLPKQVSPYRIDFPHTAVKNVESIRMLIQPTLVPAAADPVIGVINQKLDVDALDRKVLNGQLLNQSGQVVHIPHVIATFYDHGGKVIWVSDSYVDRALFPMAPEPFAIEIPGTIADKVQSYHVVVNQYTLGKS